MDPAPPVSPAKARSPERTCVGCGRRRPKAELWRLSRDEAGTLVLDMGGRGAGRGAYLCRDRGCWRQRGMTSRLGRALRCRLSEHEVEPVTHELEGLLAVNRGATDGG